MNKYTCFWRSKQMVVSEYTSYAAQLKAAAAFKAKKSYEVTAILLEKDGVSVVHQPQDICP